MPIEKNCRNILSALVNRYSRFISRHFVIAAICCYGSIQLNQLFNYLHGANWGDIDYMLTQYSVNYLSYGFIKRGFVGTLFYFVSPSNLMAAIWIWNSAIFLLLIGIVRHCFRDMGSSPSVDILKTLFAISPFAAFQFSYDIGRLDLTNIVLLILSMNAVVRGRRLTVLVVSVVAILIHEAILFYGIPVLFAMMLAKRNMAKDVRDSSTYSLLFLFGYICACLAVALLIYQYGNSSAVVAHSLGNGQEAWSRPLVQPGFYKSPLDSVIEACVLILLYGWLFAVYKKNKSPFDLFVLAAMSPMALFLFGWDIARWCALIFVTIAAIISYKIMYEKWELDWRTLKYGVAIFMVPLGPIGTMEFFPYLVKVPLLISKSVARFL